MERDQQVLAEIESVNGGKGVRIARDLDIGDTIGCLRCADVPFPVVRDSKLTSSWRRYYAGWAGKVHGETIETAPKTKLAYTLLEPIGVAGQVIPWNYPVRVLFVCS
jgi:aldehyde dehydrogenase (NAD+)